MVLMPINLEMLKIKNRLGNSKGSTN